MHLAPVFTIHGMKQLHLFDSNEEPEKILETPQLTYDQNPYLGPASPHMGYKKYIKSKDWANKSRFAKYKRDYKCQQCGRKGLLHTHHLNYDSLYHERLDDVKVLCEKCHPSADLIREYNSSLDTWASKNYGEDYYLYIDEARLEDEFDEWIEWKESEDDY